MTAQRYFGSGEGEREFALKTLRLRKRSVPPVPHPNRSDVAWLITLHHQLAADEQPTVQVKSLPRTYSDLHGKGALSGFVGLLQQECNQRKLFGPTDELPDRTRHATVPLLLTGSDGRGVVASLHLQMIPGNGAIFRHPALSFIPFSEGWHEAIQAAWTKAKANDTEASGYGFKNFNVVWNVVRQDGKGLAVGEGVKGGSGGGAFDLALRRLQNRVAIADVEGVAITAGISQNGNWSPVQGYLAKIREARSSALPPIHFFLVARTDPPTDEFAAFVPRYQKIGDGIHRSTDAVSNPHYIIEARNLDEGLAKIDEARFLDNPARPRMERVSGFLREKEAIDRKFEEIFTLPDRRSHWLKGPAGTGKTLLLKYLREWLHNRGLTPLYVSCRNTNESGARVVRELKRQARWQGPGPNHQPWVIIDGVDQITEGPEELWTYLNEQAKAAVYVLSSLHPRDPKLSARAFRTHQIDDFRDPSALAGEMIRARNQELPPDRQLTDALMTEILKSPPPPLGLTLCLEAIERDRSSPFRTDPNSWKRDVGEVLRHRLETRRETLERLGPNGSAHRMLAILGQLRLGAGERLERTEETVGQLTGLSFRDFEALSREVDWLFEEGNSVLFRYPAYVRAVAELWPTADPDGGREIHAVLATQCLSILKEWLDRAKSCPSVALEPLPQYALRHLAAHLFRARGMGEKWGDLLLDWNYLRQFHRHFGAFALLEQFPDHGGAAGSSGMTESQVDSVMTLRKLLQAEHARLDAARGDLLPKD